MAGEVRPPRRPGAGFGLTAAVCAVFVAGMVGMSFAAVPLYRIFCQATGYQGTTRQAAAGPEKTVDRLVTIRFDANIANGLGWSFRPVKRSILVKVGEVATVEFLAENRTGAPTTGHASFNVQPDAAGAYFNKLSCFCLTDQTLAAGQKIEMPVVFFVDPAIADDPDLKGMDTITLSYSFFPADAPSKPLAAANPATIGGKPL
jgi:cytochrome c oxidase assembly protein subunit 11